MSLLTDFAEKAKQTEGVIDLSIGDLDFPVSLTIDQAIRQALNDGKTHYTPVAGMPELRKLAAHDFQQDGIETANHENTIIGAGAKPFISLAIRALLADKAKDEFIIFDPSYPSYKRAVLNYGGVCKTVDTFANGFHYPYFRDIQKNISQRTKCIIVNYPNNPTGLVCSPRELADLPQDVWFLLDEAYCRLIYGSAYNSPAVMPQVAQRAIVIRSCSKTFAMSGLRIGYLTAPQKMADTIMELLSDEFGCPSSLSQEAAIAAFLSANTTEGLGRLGARRDCLCAWLDNHNISYPKPEGAFYAFADFSQWGSSVKIAEKLLLQAKVAVTPGTAFGDYDGWIRISYASADLAKLKEALLRTEKVLFT